MLTIKDLVYVCAGMQNSLVAATHVFEVEFKEHLNIIEIGILFSPWGLENGITKPIWIWFPFSYIINNVSHKLW